MHIGEPVMRADGTTATVVAIRVVPGAAAMWDLTVSNLHTFAVGTGEYVVHNCDFKTFYGNNKHIFENEDEAKAAYRSVQRARAHAPSEFKEDGQVFDNKEGALPGRQHGYYQEWTVQYGPEYKGAESRGVRRIVTGRNRNEVWYTRTHYGTAPRSQGYSSHEFFRLWWRH